MLRSSKSYSFLSSFPFYVRDSNLLPADILSSLPFGSFLFKKKQYSSLNSGWFFVFLLRVIIGFTLFSGRLFSRCIRVHISTKMKSLSSHIQTKKYSLRASGEEFMHTAELDFCYDDISQDVLFKGNLFVRYKLRSCISSNLSSSNKKVSHNVNLNTFSSFFDQCLKQVSHTSRPYGQSNFRLMGSSCFFRGTNAFLVSIVNSLSLVDLGVGAYPRCQYLNRGALFYVFYFVLFLI